ncbi:Beta-barrel assembly-enhancing protease [anaerobic digester metagenome]
MLIMLFSCSASKINVKENYIANVVNSYSNSIPKDLPIINGEISDISIFWDYVKNNSLALKEYVNDKSRFKKNTSKDFGLQLSNNKYLYKSDHISLSEKISRNICGDNYKEYLKQIIIEPMGSLNAYAVPNGDIYLSEELVDLFREKNFAIDGIIAHEIAHLILKHSEINYYEKAKLNKSANTGKFITGFLVGMASFGLAAAQTSAGAHINDYSSYSNLAVNSAHYIGSMIDDSILKRKFEYSREQEVEADIVACMYLMWIGQDPNTYVDALEELPDSYFISVYDTHPSNSFRVETLKSFIKDYKVLLN